jgi:sarcosine oxidase subunit alpha
VDTSQGAAQGRVIDIAAPRIVLATGSLERLPIFGGNRLPGVIGTLDAYELASRYGVWQGQSAVVATSSNPAYRLAMLASDAGIAIGRVLDSRPNPASRFIAFSRAYGMVQSPGTIPVSAAMARAGGLLQVHSDRSDAPVMATDRLLVSGGWQPDLTLWHVAGGASQWHQAHGRLEAAGQREAIVLAGSAAGYFTRRGCIQSGADAIDQLLGRDRRAVDDPQIDRLYETPDGSAGIAPENLDGGPSYLDGGLSMLQRPAPTPRRTPWFFRPRRETGLLVLSEAPQPLAVCDIAAGVDLGLIPPAAAGIVAQERVALVPLSRQSADATPAAAPTSPVDPVPPYLQGRFGRDAQLVTLVCDEPRQFDPGALVYPGSDGHRPPQAVGVVLRHSEVGTIALVSARTKVAGQPVVVRDKGSTRVRLRAMEG